MNQMFNIGDVIGGYCNGFFGRDDYDDKTCVFITPRYAVFEYNNTKQAAVLNYTENLDTIVDNWRKGT